ncbi:unnamed protein product, partial [Didymodactylos carnosus]
ELIFKNYLDTLENDNQRKILIVGCDEALNEENERHRRHVLNSQILDLLDYNQPTYTFDMKKELSTHPKFKFKQNNFDIIFFECVPVDELVYEVLKNASLLLKHNCTLVYMVGYKANNIS